MSKHKAFEDWMNSINEEHPKNLLLHRDMLREIWQEFKQRIPEDKLTPPDVYPRDGEPGIIMEFSHLDWGIYVKFGPEHFSWMISQRLPDYPRIKWSPQDENYLSQEIWVIIQEIYGVEQ
jgi:hypothetical protein